jgi:hypothetical protein
METSVTARGKASIPAFFNPLRLRQAVPLRGKKGWTYFVAIALFALLAHVEVMAQSGGTGALAGTVTDPTRAVIPGVTVTLISNDSGQTRTTVTEGNGAYRFGLLSPGSYRVTFTSKGFGSSVVPKVAIDVTETAALDSTLTPGSESQEVTVTSGPQAVDATSSTLGTLVGSREITAIPLSTRNYTQTLSFSAGVVTDVSNAGTLGNSTNDIYVNGGSNVDNNFQMDGAEVNDIAAGEPGSQGPFGGIPIPNPDAIQEFKIQTTLYDAGYGRNAGGNVNVVTKSGTNALHGAVWEFFRNDALNANDYFLKQTGQRRPELKQNQFGGALGGPIVKDKLFFFGSYQGTRQINGLSNFGRSTVFLPAGLTNNRSAAVLGSTFCQVQNSVVAPPGTQLGTGFYGGQAINCTGSNINPIALNLLTLKNADGSYFVPTPQAVVAGASGTVGVSNFSAPARYNEDQFIANLDAVFNAKHTLSVRYVQLHAPASTNFTCVNIGLGGSAPCAPGSPGQENYDNNVATLKLTSLLTKSLVNEARVSYVRSGATTPTTDPNSAASVGLPTLNANHPQLPVIVVNGLFQLGGNISDGNGSYSNQYQIADQVSFVHRAHSVRAGIEAETAQANDRGYGEERGELNFQSFNDFLLGGNATANGSPYGFGNIFETVGLQGGVPAEQLNFRLHDIDSFVADDITVNPQLTLNVGLRWDINGKVFENSGNLVNVFTSLASAVATPPATGTYAGFTVANNYKGTVPAGVVRRSNDNPSASGTPLTNFAPRFGFSLRPLARSNTFVVRGGYGIFISRLSVLNEAGSSPWYPPNASFFLFAGPGPGGAGPASFQNPYANAPPLGFPLRTPTSGIGGTFVAERYNSPLTHEFSLDTQYEFKPTWVAELSYVGTIGTRLSAKGDINEAQLASATNPIRGITTNTLANASSRTPLEGFSPAGFAVVSSEGRSSYNSLQATLRKQMSHGLQLQAAYTLGKVLTDLSGSGAGLEVSPSRNSNDPLLPGQQYGRADYDRHQRLIVNFLYQFPALRAGDGLARTAVNGWSVSGVVTAQSGLAMTLVDDRGGTVYGNAATSRAQTCAGYTQANLLTTGDIHKRLNNFFNTAAFCSPPVIGDDHQATGYGNLSRGIVSGPKQLNTDMAVAKSTRLHGFHPEDEVQFRAEAFNVFNHAQFSNPVLDAGNPTFGQISTTSVAPRVLQFALKYIF